MSDAPATPLTEYRLSMIEKTLESNGKALEKITQLLSQLTQLDQKQVEQGAATERAFNEIADHEVRLRKIEADLPIIELTSGWIVAGVLGAIGLAGGALFKVVVG